MLRHGLVLRADDLDRPFAGPTPELLAVLTPALTAYRAFREWQGVTPGGASRTPTSLA